MVLNDEAALPAEDACDTSTPAIGGNLQPAALLAAFEVVDQPGFPATINGCGNDDLSTVLDDEAQSPVENVCSTGPPAIGEEHTPNNPLSIFDGESSAGTWRLNVADLASGDTGEFIGWCLGVDRSPASSP